ncbi:DUF7341 domain-containing protein [Micromonospora polyrhachis]|nr:hypothetical protein [Micromonospora polyrhachis]
MTPTAHADTLTADVDQLTKPIHVAIQGRIITHPSLLDALRDACTPSANSGGNITRRAPTSRPPARLDTIDRLAEIYVGISTWHSRLNLPSPPRNADWQKAVLRAFPAAVPDLAPAIADYLRDEIHDWWRVAAVGSGWRPEQLRKLR